MTKIFCDKCGMEMSYSIDKSKITVNSQTPLGDETTVIFDLCCNCSKEFYNYLRGIKIEDPQESQAP